MGKPAVSLRNKLIALCAAALLACGLAPAVSLADDSQAIIASQVGASSGVASGLPDQANDSTDSSSDDSQQVSASQDAGTSRVAPMLAAGLFGTPISFVRSDVALDASDPIVGSFTVDGLTYAVNDGEATLVAVDAAAVSDDTIAIPSTVTYDGTTYPAIAIGPYAFYLSGATDVALPGSIASVDDRTFRSSDVEQVTVDADNPNLASFDGCLYDSQLTRLLLIPEGRKGSVLLSCETEVVQASLFSHCSLVEAISVEEGGAAFASWDGLLYSLDGTTLLRVPAGATDITIRAGCTTIAAGALEGCAKLERIDAPATVTSISPDVFTSIPTVALPAQTAVQDTTNSGVASGLPDQVKEPADSSGAEGEAEVSPRRVVASSQGLEAPLALPDLGSTSASPSSEASGAAPQLTAMVALSFADDDLPEVDPASIEVILPDVADETRWRDAGFSALVTASDDARFVSIQSAEAYAGGPYVNVTVHSNGHRLFCYTDYFNGPGTPPIEHQEGLWPDDFSYTYPIYCWRIEADPYGGAQLIFNGEPNYPYWGQAFSGREEPGWTVSGWASTPTSTNPMTDQPMTCVGGELYAIWRANTYTISLDAQGGNVSPSSVAATYDQDATLPEPTKEGCFFRGWNTAPDGTGTNYAPGQAVRNLTDQDGATVTLYAQWGPFAISYVDEITGSSVLDESTGISVGEGYFLQPSYVADQGITVDAELVRDGYAFAGWKLQGSTDAPSKAVTIAPGTVGPRTFVACWAEKHLLWTTNDVALGAAKAGDTLPQAWWAIDGQGELRVTCDGGVNPMTGQPAIISQKSRINWAGESGAGNLMPWILAEYSPTVRSIRTELPESSTGPGLRVERDPSYQITRDNFEQNPWANGIDVAWWFQFLPNLTDISGVELPDDLCASGLFYGCFRLTSTEGKYGAFRMPASRGNWNNMFGRTSLTALPEGFSIPPEVRITRGMFYQCDLQSLPEGFSIPDTCWYSTSMFSCNFALDAIPASLDLRALADNGGPGIEAGPVNAAWSFSLDGREPEVYATEAPAYCRQDYVDEGIRKLHGFKEGDKLPTYYAGDLSRLYGGAYGKTEAEVRALWRDYLNRELITPADLAGSAQRLVRFQVPKADGAGYDVIDRLTDEAGRATAPSVSAYGYSSVKWKAPDGTVLAEGPVGAEGLSFDASALPALADGAAGPVTAELAGLVMSMDMPVGSGNAYFEIRYGEVMATGVSAAADGSCHNLAFRSFTAAPTALSAEVAMLDAPDGQPVADKLFPDGIEAGTGYAFKVGSSDHPHIGFADLLAQPGQSRRYADLARLDAATGPALSDAGTASGEFSLHLAGANRQNFEQMTTFYSISSITWTLSVA